MALVAAKCTMCGSELTVDNSLKSAKCPSCDMEYIVQDAINYHNTYNVTNIGHAEQVIVKDESSIDARIENANTYLITHEDYSKAKEIFQSVVNDKSGDYRGWWGLAGADSRNFTYFDCTKAEFDNIKMNVDRAFKVASPDIQASLRGKWNQYMEGVNGFRNKKVIEHNEYKAKISSDMERKKVLENQLSGLHQKKNNLLKEKEENWRRSQRPILTVGGGILAFFFILGGIGGSGPVAIIIGLAIIGALIARFVSLQSRNSSIEQKIKENERSSNSVQNDLNNIVKEILRLEELMNNLNKYI